MIEAALAHAIGDKIESGVPARRSVGEAAAVDGRMGGVLRQPRPTGNVVAIR